MVNSVSACLSYPLAATAAQQHSSVIEADNKQKGVKDTSYLINSNKEQQKQHQLQNFIAHCYVYI